MPAYEISNHAAPGEECRHNLLYWRYGEYAGIGPGAHGRVVVAGTRHATATERQPERWAERVEADGHGVCESTPLSRSEQADEALLMGLRLSEGLDLDRLAAVSGLQPKAHVVQELSDAGLIERLGPAAGCGLPGRAASSSTRSCCGLPPRSSLLPCRSRRPGCAPSSTLTPLRRP